MERPGIELIQQLIEGRHVDACWNNDELAVDDLEIDRVAAGDIDLFGYRGGNPHCEAVAPLRNLCVHRGPLMYVGYTSQPEFPVSYTHLTLPTSDLV